MIELSGRQRRYLRSLGHHLQPHLMVGAHGVAPGVVNELDTSLSVHELVKVKLGQGCAEDRHQVAETLATATDAAVAQVLGRTVLLYRRAKKPKIRLPDA